MAIVTHICDAQWAPGAMALAQHVVQAPRQPASRQVYVEEPLKEHPSILRPGADCLTLQLRCWQLPYRKVLIALKSHDSVLEESTELTARSDVDVTSQFHGLRMRRVSPQHGWVNATQHFHRYSDIDVQENQSPSKRDKLAPDDDEL
eukprot:Skav222544  [mRNA]  locus=scaffold2875:311112:313083:+ [translate_table: standard]